MVQLKVLILMVVGIININKCDTAQKTSSFHSNCDEKIIFYNSKEKIIIEKDEYSFINNDKTGFNLIILDSLKFNKLCKIINPTVKFCIENKKYIAKGNFIFSSSVPLGAKYFFPLDKNKKIVFFKRNVMSFKKI